MYSYSVYVVRTTLSYAPIIVDITYYYAVHYVLYISQVKPLLLIHMLHTIQLGNPVTQPDSQVSILDSPVTILDSPVSILVKPVFATHQLDLPIQSQTTRSQTYPNHPFHYTTPPKLPWRQHNQLRGPV